MDHVKQVYINRRLNMNECRIYYLLSVDPDELIINVQVMGCQHEIVARHTLNLDLLKPPKALL